MLFYIINHSIKLFDIHTDLNFALYTFGLTRWLYEPLWSRTISEVALQLVSEGKQFKIIQTTFLYQINLSFSLNYRCSSVKDCFGFSWSWHAFFFSLRREKFYQKTLQIWYIPTSYTCDEAHALLALTYWLSQIVSSGNKTVGMTNPAHAQWKIRDCQQRLLFACLYKGQKKYPLLAGYLHGSHVGSQKW